MRSGSSHVIWRMVPPTPSLSGLFAAKRMLSVGGAVLRGTGPLMGPKRGRPKKVDGPAPSPALGSQSEGIDIGHLVLSAPSPDADAAVVPSTRKPRQPRRSNKQTGEFSVDLSTEMATTVVDDEAKRLQEERRRAMKDDFWDDDSDFVDGDGGSAGPTKRSKVASSASMKKAAAMLEYSANVSVQDVFEAHRHIKTLQVQSTNQLIEALITARAMPSDAHARRWASADRAHLGWFVNDGTSGFALNEALCDLLESFAQRGASLARARVTVWIARLLLEWMRSNEGMAIMLEVRSLCGGAGCNNATSDLDIMLERLARVVYAAAAQPLYWLMSPPLPSTASDDKKMDMVGASSVALRTNVVARRQLPAMQSCAAELIDIQQELLRLWDSIPTHPASSESVGNVTLRTVQRASCWMQICESMQVAQSIMASSEASKVSVAEAAAAARNHFDEVIAAMFRDMPHSVADAPSAIISTLEIALLPALALWTHSERKALYEKAITRVSHILQQCRSPEASAAIMSENIFAALQKCRMEAPDVYTATCNEFLICARIVIASSNRSDVVKPVNDELIRVVIRLVELGLPQETLLSSQLCVQADCNDVLSILRTLRTTGGTANTFSSLPLQLPEIVKKTITTHISNRVRRICEVTAGQLSATVDWEAIRPEFEEIASNTVNALAEFSLRSMRPEAAAMATQMIAVVTSLERIHSNDMGMVLDFIVHYMKNLLNMVVLQQERALEDSVIGTVRDVWNILSTKLNDLLGVCASRAARKRKRSVAERDIPRVVATPTSSSSELADVCDVGGLCDIAAVTCALSAFVGEGPQRSSSSTAAGMLGFASVGSQVTALQNIALLIICAENDSVVIGRRLHNMSRVLMRCHEAFGLRSADRQSAAKLLQSFLEGCIEASAGQEIPLLSGTQDLCHEGFLVAMRLLCGGDFSLESEAAALLHFRQFTVEPLLIKHLNNEETTWTESSLQLAADLIYLKRSAHLVSDEFDAAFTKVMVRMLPRPLSPSSSSLPQANLTAEAALQILATSSVMLYRGDVECHKHWRRRFETVFPAALADRVKHADFVVPYSFSGMTRALQSIVHTRTEQHREALRVLVRPLVERSMMPLMLGSFMAAATEETQGGSEPTNAIPLTTCVEALRIVVEIATEIDGEKPATTSSFMTALILRIQKHADQLGLADCGDVAGLVSKIALRNFDSQMMHAVLALPLAVRDRVMTHRMQCTANEVSRIVHGFSTLNATEQQRKIRDQILAACILRTMQTTVHMSPEELLCTLEAYLRIRSSHMSLIGVLLARISDNGSAFSLEQTVRLINFCTQLTNFDAKVHKACVAAAQPVFLALVSHLLRNDVMAIVGTADHAEMILNCMSAVFPREPVAEDVLKMIARYAAHVPIDGIIAALRLIAKRETTDFSAVNSLFQHVCNVLLPTCSFSNLGTLVLLLAQCDNRSATLFAAIEQRLDAIMKSPDIVEMLVSGSRCAIPDIAEAYLLARRGAATTCCKMLAALVREARGSGSYAEQARVVLQQFSFKQLRSLIVLVSMADIILPAEYVDTVDSLLTQLCSNLAQHATADSALLTLDEGVHLLTILVKWKPMSVDIAVQDTESTRLRRSLLEDAAVALLQTSVFPNLQMPGHVTKATDVARFVEVGLVVTSLLPLQQAIEASHRDDATNPFVGSRMESVLNAGLPALCTSLECAVAEWRVISGRHVLCQKVGMILSHLETLRSTASIDASAVAKPRDEGAADADSAPQSDVSVVSSLEERVEALHKHAAALRELHEKL